MLVISSFTYITCVNTEYTFTIHSKRPPYIHLFFPFLCECIYVIVHEILTMHVRYIIMCSILHTCIIPYSYQYTCKHFILGHGEAIGCMTQFSRLCGIEIEPKSFVYLDTTAVQHTLTPISIFKIMFVKNQIFKGIISVNSKCIFI